VNDISTYYFCLLRDASCKPFGSRLKGSVFALPWYAAFGNVEDHIALWPSMFFIQD
jgi:hypothetical protein